MPATREIGVLRGGVELARQPLELFRLPDGAAAAKWGGLVFPVRAGECIALTLAACDNAAPSRATTIMPATAPMAAETRPNMPGCFFTRIRMVML